MGPMSISRSLEDTKSLAESFLKSLRPNKDGATTIGLHGDLGSGKTTFTKALAEILGVQEIITSPTFVIEKIYKLEGRAFRYLVHIDAYRLEDSKELEALGFKELLDDANNLILIEWPEKVKNILPESIRTINFAFIDERSREINF
jgi:tRNA threonylcarbamoyladenosine biosynthesis protein TsaE